MKEFKFTISGNEYEVEIKQLEGGIGKIEVNGTLYEVELHKKEEKTSKTPILMRTPVPTSQGAHKIKKSKGGLFKVAAPLPGNVLQIFVKEEDEVKKGDKLLLYEAMKMENTIFSEKTGRVKSIKVTAGDAVLQDDLLIELELEQ
ncbi:MAG: biotin/lipoyl-containing protein [Bacteroidales bacterium]|jgi:biotin carboxyl carrier protein|nr:biotin/lipoyl-containing protein [Bacteroidales bacterium]